MGRDGQDEMKKSFMAFISFLIAASLSCCAVSDSGIDGSYVIDDSSNSESDVQYITADELFEYIDTHDVSVTRQDFEGIDMDEFIRSGGGFRVGNEISPEFDWRAAIDGYWRDIRQDEMDKYLAYDIVMKDSTNEEFDAFKDSFISSLAEEGKSVESSNSMTGTPDNYIIRADGVEVADIVVGQTQYLSEINANKAGTAKAKLAKGNRATGKPAAIDFGNRDSRQFYYSKSEKFFMFFVDYGADEEKYNVVMAFQDAG